MTYPTAASRDIAASAEKVWGLVSDLPRMGEWSPENTGGKWRKGATGPAQGAMFTGKNKNGFRRWSTTATVVACDPGRIFEIAIGFGPTTLPVSKWRYEFEDTADGCRVTESWLDQRKSWMRLVARPMGVHDDAHAKGEMEATLANLAAAAEAG